MKGVRWIVPLEGGQLTGGAHDLVVAVNDQLQINLHQGEASSPLPLLDPLAACRLGQALQEAAAYAGHRRAAARGKR